MAEPGITFAYTSHNAPTTGILLTFNCTSEASWSTDYPMQLMGQYNGHSLFYRHKNGDNGTWMPWKRILTDYDYTSVLNNTYLPLSGGTMSGRINLPYNTFSLQFRSSGADIDSAYNTGTYYGTLGNECLAFVARQSVTSFMFVTGSDPAGWTSSTWNSSSPALQIKGQSVYVNSLITNGVVPSYNFYVNGTSCFNGASYFNSTTVFPDRSQINKIDFSSIQTSAPPVLALALKNAGYALYNDEEFASGNNNCQVYNNNGNGTVTIERISDSIAANTSGYILKITSIGNATPGFGGFYQTTYARANAIYFQLFRAKIPVGYSVVTASNPMGSNYKDYWITNTAGTGRWEWYGRLTICGYTGSFSSGGHVYITGSPTPSSSAPLIWYVASCNTYDLTKGAYINATKVYGAIWNDYAEYRSSNPIEPGRVICETGNGTLKLSTERLQPGANVVSDTFGFAIGETENCKTPIAVSGRALVYTYEDRYSYEAGDPVCAAPGGTVSKMSREEVMMYPDRIVGTVSEIPEYECWGTGNVEVKNRIWIRIK